MRIELTCPAWKASVLPLNYTRNIALTDLNFVLNPVKTSINVKYYTTSRKISQGFFHIFYIFVNYHKYISLNQLLFVYLAALFALV